MIGHFNSPGRILTKNGTFDISNPRRQDVSLEDMLHATGNLCRYTGHVQFYSVLAHSLFCHDLATDFGYGREERFECLVHDMHEAYIGDLSSPMKRTVDQPYREVEHRVEAVVREWFELGEMTEAMKNDVRFVDLTAARAEMDYFFADNPAYPSVKWGNIPKLPFDTRYLSLSYSDLVVLFWEKYD